MSNPFPIGETIHLAACPYFTKYSDQHVAINERIPHKTAALIAGRGGIVISEPILSSTNDVEFRRVSVLTKEGVVECQNVPLKLIKKEILSARASGTSAEKEMKDAVEKEENDKNAVARSHILMALTDSTCRTGKFAITEKANKKKMDLMLTALKKELNVKNPPPVQQPAGSSAPPDSLSDSIPEDEQSDNASLKLIGDGDRQLAPVGTCFLKKDTISVNIENNSSSGNSNSKKNDIFCQENDNMFSVQSTLIENHPETEQYMNDVVRINEAADIYSSAIKDMLTATDNHAKVLQQKYKKPPRNASRVGIQKHLQRRKMQSNNIINAHASGEGSVDEASNSEFIFLNSITEANIEDSMYQEYSESIGNLSTAGVTNLTHYHSSPFRPGVPMKSKGSKPHPTKLRVSQPRSKVSHSNHFTPKPPNIKISHLLPNKDPEIKTKNETRDLETKSQVQKQAGEWEALIMQEEGDRKKEGISCPEKSSLQKFLQDNPTDNEIIQPQQQPELVHKKDSERRQHSPAALEYIRPPSSGLRIGSSQRQTQSPEQKLVVGSVSKISINLTHRPARPRRPPSSSRGPRCRGLMDGNVSSHAGIHAMTKNNEFQCREEYGDNDGDCKAQAVHATLVITSPLKS